MYFRLCKLFARLRARLIHLVLRVYLSHKRSFFRVMGLKVWVPGNCFPPNLVSTGLLLKVALEKARGIVVEAGTGVGSLALPLCAFNEVEVVGTDLDLKCLRAARKNALENSVYALFNPVACEYLTAIRSNCADLALTNPPYLPLDPERPEDISICGGKKLETYARMIKECIRVARHGTLILFTASSLTNIKFENAKELARRFAGLDSIYVYEIQKE